MNNHTHQSIPSIANVANETDPKLIRGLRLFCHKHGIVDAFAAKELLTVIKNRCAFPMQPRQYRRFKQLIKVLDALDEYSSGAIDTELTRPLNGALCPKQSDAINHNKDTLDAR